MGMVLLFFNYLYAFVQFVQITQPLNGVDPGGDPGFPIVESIAALVSGGILLGIRTFIKQKGKKD